MRANIAIYFTDQHPDGYPFTEPGYLDAYFDLAQKIQRKGANVFFARGAQSYLGDGYFSAGWQFTHDKKFSPLHVVIKSDIIFNRQRGLGFFKPTKNALILNHPDLDAICTDKWLTYTTFPQLSPKTVLVQRQAWSNPLRSEKIILKPRYGDNCKGVTVVDRARLPKKPFTVEYIAQEFLHLEKGMPGVCRCRHELRIFMANGKPQLAYINLIKDPKRMIVTAGDRSDCRQEIPLSKLPSAVLAFVKKIDAPLKQFHPRLYSVDIGWDYIKNAPLLIELNSRPGLPNPKFSWYNKQLTLVADVLCSSLRTSLSRRT